MCSPEPQPTYEQLATLAEWLAERCARLEQELESLRAYAAE